MMKLSAFVLILIFGIQAGSIAHAQMLDTVLDSDASVGTDAGIDADASVDTSITTEATSSDAETTDADTALSAEFSIDRGNLNDGTNYSVSDPQDVRTAASLESYAGAMVREDERVKEIEFRDGTLNVRYMMDGKFLGFIPGSMTVHAMVSPEGEVSVSYPWYAFFMTKAESRADLEMRLKSELAAIENELAEEMVTIEGGVETRMVQNTEAHRMALTLERLRASLYANASADAQR